MGGDQLVSPTIGPGGGGTPNLLGLYDWRRAEPQPDEEEVPTHLNTITCGHFLVISTDKLSAEYNWLAQHGNDVGAIQGNRPAPHQRLLYYFEITVKDRGQKGVISIGFTDENFKMSRQPGWEPNSYGYHGDDGLLYHGAGVGSKFGPTFTTNDIVGAGINYGAQELFFTKNGKMVGTAFKETRGPLYPTIGLHSPNEKVEVNFGQNPFKFDVDALVQEERDKRQKLVESVPLALSVSHSVVRTYLLHYGYQDTLTAFDTASGGTFRPPAGASSAAGASISGAVDETSYALEHRKILRRLARAGDIDGVFAKLREWYPDLLRNGVSPITFPLHCQKYIEMVKAGSLEAAVSYARTEMANFFGISPLEDDHLKDCLALLAYEHPEKSPVSYLLHIAQREAVADAVNAVVLATNPTAHGRPPQSALEKLLRQLTACLMEKRHMNGGQGEIFTLQRVLQGGKDGGW